MKILYTCNIKGIWRNY